VCVRVGVRGCLDMYICVVAERARAKCKYVCASRVCESGYESG